jgi:23S rRNA pseudouridine1911/1915/1917 synthase
MQNDYMDALDTDLGLERRSLRVGIPAHGLRLDKWLAQCISEYSRSHLQSLIEGGHVLLEGQAATSASRKLRAGQAVLVNLVPPPESLAFQPEAMTLDVVYEDEHVLVLNKPAGLVVHPAAGNWSGTLLNGLLARDPAAAQLPRAGIVHRLDKDTSGLMVVGRTLAAVTSLVRDMAERLIRRRYIALVHGELRQEAFSLDGPIGRDSAVRVRMAVVGSGKPARTDVSLVAVSQGVSAVRCALHTGRTHQIRVHLSHDGFPLLGDAVYGGKPLLGMQRQALHAAELGFEHPISRVPLLFTAEAPADLAAAWQTVLKGDSRG